MLERKYTAFSAKLYQTNNELSKIKKIMVTERVSRDDIRAINVGQTGVFVLPSEKAVESARVQFATLKRLEGMDFECVETGERLTIAYKRIK